MRQFFSRMFYGRNGLDHLGIFTWCVTGALFVATMISHSVVVYFLACAMLAWSVFRMLSTKRDRRYLENQRFDQFFYRIKYFFTDTKARAEERKIYVYYKCPSCKQKLRVPRGHGKIEIRCPKCGEKFVKRT